MPKGRGRTAKATAPVEEEPGKVKKSTGRVLTRPVVRIDPRSSPAVQNDLQEDPVSVV